MNGGVEVYYLPSPNSLSFWVKLISAYTLTLGNWDEISYTRFTCSFSRLLGYDQQILHMVMQNTILHCKLQCLQQIVQIEGKLLETA